MLELEIVDQAQAHYRVRDSGVACGAISHEDRTGRRSVQLDDAVFVLQCNHRAANERAGLLRAIWNGLRPDLSYSLRDGATSLAELRNVVRWGRGGDVALTGVAGQAWTVHAEGLVPRQLRLRCDGRDVASLQIEGTWRERLRMPPTPLPRGIAVALGFLAHQVWGNDPYRGDGGSD